MSEMKTLKVRTNTDDVNVSATGAMQYDAETSIAEAVSEGEGSLVITAGEKQLVSLGFEVKAKADPVDPTPEPQPEPDPDPEPTPDPNPEPQPEPDPDPEPTPDPVELSVEGAGEAIVIESGVDKVLAISSNYPTSATVTIISGEGFEFDAETATVKTSGKEVTAVVTIVATNGTDTKSQAVTITAVAPGQIVVADGAYDEESLVFEAGQEQAIALKYNYKPTVKVEMFTGEAVWDNDALTIKAEAEASGVITFTINNGVNVVSKSIGFRAIAPVALSASVESLTVVAGQADTFVITANTQEAPSASVENEEVATVVVVDNNVRVSGVAVGETKVTVTASNGINSKSVEILVTVDPVPVVIDVDETPLTIINGESTTRAIISNYNPVAEVVGTAVAYDTNFGTITALAVGTATVNITVTNGKDTVVKSFTVQVIEKLTVDPVGTSEDEPKLFEVGQELAFDVVSNAEEFEYLAEGVAKYNKETKVITASEAGVGSVKVTVKLGEQSETVTYFVKAIAPVELSVDSESVTVVKGQQVAVNVTTIADNVTASVKDDASEVSVVYADGVATITGVELGSATIVVAASNALARKTVEIAVVVDPVPVELTLDETPIEVVIGNSLIQPVATSNYEVAVTAPEGFILDDSIEGVRRYATTGLAAGEYTFTFSATNGKDTVTKSVVVKLLEKLYVTINPAGTAEAPYELEVNKPQVLAVSTNADELTFEDGSYYTFDKDTNTITATEDKHIRLNYKAIKGSQEINDTWHGQGSNPISISVDKETLALTVGADEIVTITHDAATAPTVDMDVDGVVLAVVNGNTLEVTAVATGTAVLTLTAGTGASAKTTTVTVTVS